MRLTYTVSASDGASDPYRILFIGRPRPNACIAASRWQVSWLAGPRLIADLPGFPVVTIGSRLAAYSCGGSHGFGPDWVVLTVFPINPLEFIRRGTITGAENTKPAPSLSIQALGTSARPGGLSLLAPARQMGKISERIVSI
jgi:hypothetical protein